MKLSKHGRFELLLLTGLALGSCDRPQAFRASDADRLEVADANARHALGRLEYLETRIEKLERDQRQSD